MKYRDQLLLENIYSRMLLKEDPDTVEFQKDGKWDAVNYNDLEAQAFGFFDINRTRLIKDQGETVEFSGFPEDWKEMIYITSPYKEVGFEEGTHSYLAKTKLMEDLLESPTGIITFKGFYKNIHIDLSKKDEKTKFDIKVLSNINPRRLLTPSGRIWPDTGIISFWCHSSEVKKEHLERVRDAIGIAPEAFNAFKLEFGEDTTPKTTVGEYIGSTAQPKETTPEEKKKTEDAMRKAHGAAAVGTKDKDVQDIIDKRKKAMAAAESELRAKGIRPDLKARQQAMTSESIQKN